MNSPLLNVMTAAAIKAGKGLLRDFGEVDHLQVSKKGPANFVTKTDVRTEKLLQRELATARPDFGFLLEEGGEIAGKDGSHRWIIDPLDGTTNFIHAIPYFCTSIGLEKNENGKSEIIAGVIFDPIHNELFAAEKGKGAFVNNRRLTVSSRDGLEDSMIVCGIPRLTPDSTRTALDTMTQRGATIRNFGAAALELAHVAAGRIDACWYHSLKPWDIAAAMLLIQEAQGTITGIDGKPMSIYSQSLVAANPSLHLHIRKLLS